jgi:hypothetical protein
MEKAVFVFVFVEDGGEMRGPARKNPSVELRGFSKNLILNVFSKDGRLTRSVFQDIVFSQNLDDRHFHRYWM